jgi:glutamine cyclotransferase
MTVDDESLLVTNHWNGARSGLYRVDRETGEILAEATMPAEAKHTSGLTRDGEWLWALDHESNRLYKLDCERTFEKGEAAVEARYDTGLRGSSGLTRLEANREVFFVISDFLWTIETTPSLPVGSARTYFVPRERIESGIDVERAAKYSYPNGGYSQGLTWDGTYLYESLNNLGTDRIEILDVSEVFESVDGGDIERLGSFEGPAGRIEDLGTDGDSLWTTDEGTYNLYRLDSLGRLRESVSK